MAIDGLLELDDGAPMAQTPTPVAISPSRSGWSGGLWRHDPPAAPEDPPGHQALAEVRDLARDRRSEEARARLAATEAASARGAWLRTAALVAEEELQDEEALGLWRELARLEPAALDAHAALAALLEPRIGALGAADQLIKALGRRTADPAAMRLLLDWLRRPGLGERRVAVARALAGGGTAWAQRELAWALLEQGDGDLDGAGAACRRAEAAEPGAAAGILLAAELAWRRGDRRGARERWLDALRSDADCAPAVERLAAAATSAAEAYDALQSAGSELRLGGGWSAGLEAWARLLPLLAAPATAARELRALAGEQPESWPAHAACAGQLLRCGEADEARTLLAAATARFPACAPLWELLAAADPAGAAAALERAVAADPGASGALRALAGRSDAARARALLAQDCRHHPRCAESHLLLGRLLLAQGEAAAGRARLAHAAALAPRDDRAWDELAALDGDAAEALAAELGERRPADPERWLRLAAVLARRGQAAAARRLECAERAIALAPREVRAHLLRARCLAALGRAREADEACEPPGWNGRAPAELRRLCAELRRARGDTAGAIDALHQLLTRQPADLEARLGICRLLLDHGDVREAVVEGEHAARLHPASAEAHAVRGDALRRLGDRPGALASLARALELDPGQRRAAAGLFDLALDAGDLHQAESALAAMARGGEDPALGARRVLLAMRRNRPAEAAAALAALARAPGGDLPALDRALAAMDAPAAAEAALAALDQALPASDSPEAVAERWARLWLRLRPRAAAAARLAALLGKAPTAGAAAARHWIARLAEAGADAADDLLALLREHGRAIGRDDRCWGEAGRALLRLAGPEAAATWLADWQGRAKAAPWALAAASEVLRRLGRDDDADAAARAALARGEDPASWQPRLWLAARSALAGNPAGADAVRTAPAAGDPYWAELRQLAQAALLAAGPEPDAPAAWDALEAAWKEHGAAIKAGREAPELARLRAQVAERIAAVQGGMMAGLRARWLGRGGGRDDG